MDPTKGSATGGVGGGAAPATAQPPSQASAMSMYPEWYQNLLAMQAQTAAQQALMQLQQQQADMPLRYLSNLIQMAVAGERVEDMGLDPTTTAVIKGVVTKMRQDQMDQMLSRADQKAYGVEHNPMGLQQAMQDVRQANVPGLQQMFQQRFGNHTGPRSEFRSFQEAEKGLGAADARMQAYENLFNKQNPASTQAQEAWLRSQLGMNWTGKDADPVAGYYDPKGNRLFQGASARAASGGYNLDSALDQSAKQFGPGLEVMDYRTGKPRRPGARPEKARYGMGDTQRM